MELFISPLASNKIISHAFRKNDLQRDQSHCSFLLTYMEITNSKKYQDWYTNEYRNETYYFEPRSDGVWMLSKDHATKDSFGNPSWNRRTADDSFSISKSVSNPTKNTLSYLYWTILPCIWSRLNLFLSWGISPKSQVSSSINLEVETMHNVSRGYIASFNWPYWSVDHNWFLLNGSHSLTWNVRLYVRISDISRADRHHR